MSDISSHQYISIKFVSRFLCDFDLIFTHFRRIFSETLKSFVHLKYILNRRTEFVKEKIQGVERSWWVNDTGWTVSFKQTIPFISVLLSI